MHKLHEPLSWPVPERIFVNDMGDTFHALVSDHLIEMMIQVMRRTDWHQYLLLTKRVNRMAKFLSHITIPANVWVGTSIENRKLWARAERLKDIDARVRFVSIEPLLESIGKIDLSGIHWVVVGGESGPTARRREMNLDWAREIRDQCIEQKVAFFYKQGSGPRPSMYRELDGRLWQAFPVPLSLGRLYMQTPAR